MKLKVFSLTFLILLKLFLTLFSFLFILFILLMKLPVNCPSCMNQLEVTKLSCKVCETAVIGRYKLPVYTQLDDDEQEFIIQFLLNSGSLKEMANQMNRSYPTVRNKLDDLIAKINKLKNDE